MKNIYITEPNKEKLEDILDIIGSCPNQEGYHRIINVVDVEQISDIGFYDMLRELSVDSLDLIVLPIDIGGLPNFEFENDPERYVDGLKSVQMALSFREQGYEGSVILTQEGYFTDRFMSHVEGAGKLEDRPFDVVDIIQGGYSFIKLYSTGFPEETKNALILSILEGVPQFEWDVIYLGGKERTIH